VTAASASLDGDSGRKGLLRLAVRRAGSRPRRRLPRPRATSGVPRAELSVAGIAQPGFYAHFKNVDELVQTAIMQVLEEMRVKIGDARRRAFARFAESSRL